MSRPLPARRRARALIAVELAAVGTATAIGLAIGGHHPVAALAVAGGTAFLALTAIAAALNPEARS